MASTVITAFSEFLNEKVNLDINETTSARGSRDWLVHQLHKFPETDSTFPSLYNDGDINYGSFARRTTIRPLEDVDIMIGLAALGTTYSEISSEIKMFVPETEPKLKYLCNDGTNILNSRKVLNKIIGNLRNIHQYC